jgi:hypothetical protein
VTSGGVNPTNTICALALRCAAHIVSTRWPSQPADELGDAKPHEYLECSSAEEPEIFWALHLTLVGG